MVSPAGEMAAVVLRRVRGAGFICCTQRRMQSRREVPAGTAGFFVPRWYANFQWHCRDGRELAKRLGKTSNFVFFCDSKRMMLLRGTEKGSGLRKLKILRLQRIAFEDINFPALTAGRESH